MTAAIHAAHRLRWLLQPRPLPWAWLLSACSAALLLVPKLLLIAFSADRLWLGWSPAQLPWLLAQDLLLAGAVFALTSALLVRRPSLLRLGAAALLCTGLLVLLLLDCRVRQLWLRPPDATLIAYGWHNRADLSSGSALFFCHPAGFSFTFRRWLVGLVGVQLGLWSLGGLLLRQAAPRPFRPRAWRWPWLAVGATLAVACVAAPRYRYRLEECLLVEPWLGRLRPSPAVPSAELAQRFDQPCLPLAQAVQGPRRIAAGRRPYKNLVVWLLESVRWRGLNLDGEGATSMPTLRRLAREGLLARAHVSVPHSSKSAWTILTGRHPYPGIEMREAMREDVPCYVHDLAARGVGTWVFSSAHLAFENMDGIFQATGFERRLETAEMGQERAEAVLSSFGGDDELLTTAPGFLARAGDPFAAVFVPVAAHYPYCYPGKLDSSDGLESYQGCQAYADQVLGRVLEGLRQEGLLEDTLVVLVGDHGESFGEHGSYAHNNSLYEEETTVPLVLWSADGALRHDGVLEARHVDVAPTIADLMGVAGSDVPVQGTSLLRGEPGPRPVYLASFFDDVGYGLVEGSVKYLYTPSGGQLVRFDLRGDPLERAPEPVTGPERERIVQRLTAFAAYQRVAFPGGR